jgi:hypothetical protein
VTQGEVLLPPAPSPPPVSVPAQRRSHRRPTVISWPSICCGVFIALGSLVRIRQYAVRRSLWLDEASITDNIINRHMVGLLRPLSYHQGAPLGWLISEKIGVHLLGPNEYGLRLTSLVAGVLTLFAVWWLARRTLPRWLVPLAVLAAAVAPQLIRYSSETKQYGSDAFTVTFIVALAITLAQLRPEAFGWNSAATWAAGGAFAVFFSHPGILATASCSAVLLYRLGRGRHTGALLRFAAASAVIVAVLVVHYALVLRNLSQDTDLKSYWASGYPPKPLAFGSFGRWLGRVFVDYTHDPLHLGPALLVGLLFVVGIVSLARRKPFACALLIGPLLLQLLVTAVGVFPLSGRLVLGYVPLVLVVLVNAACVLDGRRWVTAGIACLVLVPLVPNVVNAAKLTAKPWRFEELRPVLQAVQRDYRPGQTLYVQYPARTVFTIYRLMGIHLQSDGNMYIIHAPVCQDDALLRRLKLMGKQVWFVSGHQLGTSPHEADQVRAHLRAEGTVLRDIKAPGAEAILVQLRGSYDQLTPGDPGNCLQVIRTR